MKIVKYSTMKVLSFDYRQLIVYECGVDRSLMLTQLKVLFVNNNLGATAKEVAGAAEYLILKYFFNLFYGQRQSASLMSYKTVAFKKLLHSHTFINSETIARIFLFITFSVYIIILKPCLWQFH